MTCFLTFGKVYEDNDPDFQCIHEALQCIDQGLAEDALTFFPWLRHVYETKVFKTLKHGLQLREDFMRYVMCRTPYLGHLSTKFKITYSLEYILFKPIYFFY